MIYNYHLLTLRILFKFKNYLYSQPIYLCFNLKHTVLVIASYIDVLYINLETGDEYDIDEKFQVSEIRSMMYIDGNFYVLANKRKKNRGYFLI